MLSFFLLFLGGRADRKTLKRLRTPEKRAKKRQPGDELPRRSAYPIWVHCVPSHIRQHLQMRIVYRRKGMVSTEMYFYEYICQL